MTPPVPQRLLSLDVFRGGTIIAMILVNNPGTWSHVYGPLQHAHWHGWTPTDLVFPFFLFIVGVAIPLSLGPRLERGVSKSSLVAKACRRSALLFALGLLMAIYPLFHFPLISDQPGFGLRAASWEKLRIMGVLQRIAICYLAAATAFITLGRNQRRWLIAALLILPWAALVLIPVPGWGRAALDVPEGTSSAWVDRLVLGTNHLWAGAERQWDPEGLFSTLPAIASTLFGVFTGQLIRDTAERWRSTLAMFVCGSVLVGLGTVWSWFLPINKSLWTSSYAVFTAGQAMVVLALCFWLIDGGPADTRLARLARRASPPLIVYGVNALIVFVLSGLVAKTLILVKVPFRFSGAAGVDRVSLHSWIYEHLFAPLGPPAATSLLFALTWVGCWYLVLWFLYRRGIVIKV